MTKLKSDKYLSSNIVAMLFCTLKSRRKKSFAFLPFSLSFKKHTFQHTEKTSEFLYYPKWHPIEVCYLKCVHVTVGLCGCTVKYFSSDVMIYWLYPLWLQALVTQDRTQMWIVPMQKGNRRDSNTQADFV